MISQYTKTQINKLGERLRQGELTAADIKMLDAYRRSFGPAYTTTIQILRDQLSLEPTGRPAKSTSSIIEKLRREKSRLVTIQDIAGCRIVLEDCKAQNSLLKSLPEYFPDAKIIDRRIKPSFGYRAVHYVAFVDERPIEIQTRTRLQHLWAELSEKLSDIFRPIKYGGGPAQIRDYLDSLSVQVARYENIEIQLLSTAHPIDQEQADKLASIEADMAELRVDIEEELKNIITDLEIKRILR